MRTSSNFSILFWVYKSRTTDNKAKIYTRITLKGKKLNFSLNRNVDIDSWNPKYQRCHGKGKSAIHINQFLDATKSGLLDCYRDLQNENRFITPQLIKARFLGDDIRNHTIKDVFNYHNDKMVHKLCAKTLCHYKTSQKYILEFIFEEYNLPDIQLQNLNYAFVLGFENFLRSYEPKHYQGSIGNNAVMKHIQRLKKMIRLAHDIDWIDSNPFLKFKLKLEKTEREFLSAHELKIIETLDLSIARLEVVRDLFIFSCYTGISYADIMNLTSEQIVIGIDGYKWIMARRNKTGVPFKIPILKKTAFIIEKYSNHPRTNFTGKLMPELSNQRLNSYLKEIADLCGIKKNITFHMARHTFATTVTLTNGVPIETVSKLLGHTKIATTQIYARVIERKISDDMFLLRKKIECL
ncbi:site-specific recombinase XerD [Gelidibacter algens]|uniref:Site-specific recombinase XerD n=1 Tax=Gelidibacter algens TaxID=49280 RepID=A0A1A7QY32_9FLAO|nr:site-specific integrase [Gelidibacter algens]OBX24471.1 integrase [Gelidibacter algens]RAJ19215.1 site-specific recombinase XerD [Gelidibacter algens]